MTRKFKYSGRIDEDCMFHSLKGEGPDGALVAPIYVSTAWGEVPQYSPTIKSEVITYSPATDCNGNFMSYKYHINNNCYAYGCNIATNTFPQPGRQSGGIPFTKEFTAKVVTDNAVGDGLVYVGTTIDSIKEHAASNKVKGHYVALMFSEPEQNIGGDSNANWSGDYHWARCDDAENFSSWSQKDGSDQVTNFDFAGHLISNPAEVNWRINQGPISSSDVNEYVVTYDFHCFMFVSNMGVNII